MNDSTSSNPTSAAPDRNDRNGTTNPFAARWKWKAGGAAGLIATVVMGAAITGMHVPTLRLAIAGLYGQSGNFVVGWIAHLLHGTLFGVVFALLLSDPGLHRVSEWYWKTIVAGVVYGMMLAIVGAGIIMPIWLGFAGFTTPPSIPNVTTTTLVWHLIYGLVLGGLFPALTDI